MTRNNEPQIFPPPTCFCGTAWALICKHCNVAFCASHAEREHHKCKPDEVRPYPAKRKPVQKELFKAPGNGVGESHASG